jgi:hypothetical protein
MVPDAVERFGTSGAKSNGACRPMPQMTDNGDEPLPLRCEYIVCMHLDSHRARGREGNVHDARAREGSVHE